MKLKRVAFSLVIASLMGGSCLGGIEKIRISDKVQLKEINRQLQKLEEPTETIEIENG